jgi:hypothetical protein
MKREEYVAIEFNNIIAHLRSVIKGYQDLSYISLSLQLTKLESMILDSVFKGFSTLNIGKTLLILQDDLYNMFENITCRLGYALQNKTFLEHFSLKST